MEVGESTSGWFTIHDDVMSVWEGVCMLKLDIVTYLFKIRDSNLLSIKLLNTNVNRVSSDGYWYCVELSGKLGKTESSFYYHADCARNARRMLEHLTTFTSLNITSLTIRLDPDPLRCSSPVNVLQRVEQWSQLGKEFCSDCKIVLDKEMPL
ncbi:hypothetical protein KIN20_034591 [Parelaphostrongylus tenuis]|uniref:Uncharacterized protein n=1 Tax=Parelaphostrongylus tenuis TaxID=148309 RepID=A0AAD5WJA6_PARTN|nr:hypothetical protein KIN20_034591 [Parelaphostrongylus tenuis]